MPTVSLLPRALLKVGAALVNDDDSDVDAFALQLRLCCLFQGIHVGHVRLRDGIDAGAIAILRAHGVMRMTKADHPNQGLRRVFTADCSIRVLQIKFF